MFDFLFNVGTYESRKVGRWDSGDGAKMVSTARVSDGDKEYETAFMHPEYNDGKMVIVEAYDTEAKAKEGHAKWVKTMTKGPLPNKLVDCCNAETAKLCKAVGNDMIFPRVTAN